MYTWSGFLQWWSKMQLVGHTNEQEKSLFLQEWHVSNIVKANFTVEGQ